MKTRSNHKATLLLLISLLVSCSDFLEVDPEDQNTIQQQFSTRENTLDAVAGLYREINTAFFNADFAYYGDLQAGNVRYTPDIGETNLGRVTINELPTIYDFNADKIENDLDDTYENAYQVVNAANTVLENITQTPDLTEEERDQIRSESLAARAFAHFYLARMYAQSFAFDPEGGNLGVVYNTRTLTVGVAFPARSTLAETFDLIGQDLDEALSISRGSSILEGFEKNTFSPTVIKTLMADVALWQQDYQTVFALCDEIINNAGISLTPADSYANQWLGGTDLSETIFALAVSLNTEGSISFSMNGIYPNFSGSQSLAPDCENTTDLSFADFAASGDLISLFEENDIRLTSLLGQQQLCTLDDNVELSSLPYSFTNKYNAQKGMILYRLSELYLMRAEAALMLGDNGQALEDLNTIRNRAGLESIMSNTNLESEILLERRRELAFENKTFYDLSRTGSNVTRGQDCIAATCNLTYPNPRYILPIPEESINVNSNLQQNESY